MNPPSPHPSVGAHKTTHQRQWYQQPVAPTLHQSFASPFAPNMYNSSAPSNQSPEEVTRTPTTFQSSIRDSGRQSPSSLIRWGFQNHFANTFQQTVTRPSPPSSFAQTAPDAVQRNTTHPYHLTRTPQVLNFVGSHVADINTSNHPRTISSFQPQRSNSPILKQISELSQTPPSFPSSGAWNIPSSIFSQPPTTDNGISELGVRGLGEQSQIIKRLHRCLSCNQSRRKRDCFGGYLCQHCKTSEQAHKPVDLCTSRREWIVALQNFAIIKPYLDWTSSANNTALRLVVNSGSGSLEESSTQHPTLAPTYGNTDNQLNMDDSMVSSSIPFDDLDRMVATIVLDHDVWAPVGPPLTDREERFWSMTQLFIAYAFFSRNPSVILVQRSDNITQILEKRAVVELIIACGLRLQLLFDEIWCQLQGFLRDNKPQVQLRVIICCLEIMCCLLTYIRDTFQDFQRCPFPHPLGTLHLQLETYLSCVINHLLMFECRISGKYIDKQTGRSTTERQMHRTPPLQRFARDPSKTSVFPTQCIINVVLASEHNIGHHLQSRDPGTLPNMVDILSADDGFPMASTGPRYDQDDTGTTSLDSHSFGMSGLY